MQLRSSEESSDQRRAARDEAPIDVWMEVIRERPDMRAWVAVNKTVPVAVLSVLSKDPDWHVRHAVAMKRKLSHELLLDLASDPDEGVRRAVVFNQSATRAVLEHLAADSESEIRAVAAERLQNGRYRS